MSASSLVTETPIAKAVKVSGDAIVVELRDGRYVSVPLTWYPRLAEATPRDR
jgi:hypothetical protein